MACDRENHSLRDLARAAPRQSAWPTSSRVDDMRPSAYASTWRRWHVDPFSLRTSSTQEDTAEIPLSQTLGAGQSSPCRWATPEKSVNALKESIDRGYWCTSSLPQQKRTELGVRLHQMRVRLQPGRFRNQTGTVHLRVAYARLRQSTLYRRYRPQDSGGARAS